MLESRDARWRHNLRRCGRGLCSHNQPRPTLSDSTRGRRRNCQQLVVLRQRRTIRVFLECANSAGKVSTGSERDQLKLRREFSYTHDRERWVQVPLGGVVPPFPRLLRATTELIV